MGKGTEELEYSQAPEKASIIQLELNSAAAKERKQQPRKHWCRESMGKAAEERPDPAESHGEDTNPYPVQVSQEKPLRG